MVSVHLGARARVVRERLDVDPDPLLAARWLRGQPRGIAFSGAWADGGVLLSSHPLAVAGPDSNPFDLLDTLPFALPADAGEHDGIVAGGWFGWLGFGLGRMVEPVPPPPPRPQPLPLFDLALHDHVVRCDTSGAWWFEALWTEARADVLAERLDWWRGHLSQTLPDPQPVNAGPLRIGSSGPAGHLAAVAETVERIRVGEIYQANICLRLEAGIDGDPLDLWIRAASSSRPSYAAYVGADAHAVLSLSPELFLRRHGRTVLSRPIKGTLPGSADPAQLTASAKDRAENVMIVDLMRNDLGRVCEYGSVEVEGLCALEPATGVWHLVSSVGGRLREGTTDAELLRATFPPGSVTGAPKVQALRVIHQLESTGREAYCGAVGLRSPISGLELNVAIRTFETSGGKLWIGAGGGIVSDSAPARELDEALSKARGVAAAAHVQLEAPPRNDPPPTPPTVRLPRPDPAAGILETIRVLAGRAVHLAAHLARLRSSGETLGLAIPHDIEQLINAAADELGDGGLRVRLAAAGADIASRPLPEVAAMHLEPVALPGGLGAHKWADRSMVDALSTPASTPLFCDLDGTVLEAGYAAIVIVAGDTMLAPPLDGRALVSISRGEALEAARRTGWTVAIRTFTLPEAAAADAVILTSSLRGPHPGLLAGGPGPDAARRICTALLGA